MSGLPRRCWKDGMQYGESWDLMRDFPSPNPLSSDNQQITAFEICPNMCTATCLTNNKKCCDPPPPKKKKKLYQNTAKTKSFHQNLHLHRISSVSRKLQTTNPNLPSDSFRGLSWPDITDGLLMGWNPLKPSVRHPRRSPCL